MGDQPHRGLWLDGRPVRHGVAVLDVAIHGRPAVVLHLGLVMIDPAIQGQGHSWILYGLTCLIVFVRNQFRPLWISSVTQVPAIVGKVSETFSDVYPGPEPGPRRSFEHLLLARQIMRRHRAAFGVGAEAGFDEARFVVTDSYTGGSQALKKSFEAAPRASPPAVQRFLRARTRLCARRRRPADRPDRSRREPTLPARNRAQNLAAGPAGDARLPRAAAARPARGLLAQRRSPLGNPQAMAEMSVAAGFARGVPLR